MFPTLSEAVRGQRLTVGPPFFNLWMLPVGLCLLLLTGIGPLLAWRKSTLVNLRDSFLFPTAVGVVVGVTVVALGVPIWASGLCFAFSGFVLGTITQEFWRGARVRQQSTGTDLFTALVGLVGRNKRRYGGYIVHVGIVLLFLGFAGEGFKQTEQALLKPGQQVEVGDFIVRHDVLRVTQDTQKQMVSSQVTVLHDGEPFATMYPAKWFWAKSEQPTTEVAIRRGFAEDVYVVLGAFDTGNQSATLEVTIAPLVNWIWVGFGVLALGTFIALLPDTVFAFATIKVPSNAATTSLLLLALVLAPGLTFAQTTGELVKKTPLQADLEDEIMCSCGGCRSSIKDCPMVNCHGETAQTAKLQQLIAEGKTREEIIATFVRDFGGEDVLMRPRDEGFNRLAWMFPYIVAAVAFGAVFLAARRWSSHSPAPAVAGDAGLDPTVNARLDDELRDLD
jgi:cytochrome c-type biogenesis protein CcmF